MNSKIDRHTQIRRIIAGNKISSQEELLKHLREAGFNLTQATLSRDLKEIRVGKIIGQDKESIYVLNELLKQGSQKSITPAIPDSSVLSILFSYNLCIIRTFPAYASTIATCIDGAQLDEVAGTIAGDDTVLIIPREGYSQKEILKSLAILIPAIESRLN
jgi:transcriptional regulator of arginine metabolism